MLFALQCLDSEIAISNAALKGVSGSQCNWTNTQLREGTDEAVDSVLKHLNKHFLTHRFPVGQQDHIKIKVCARILHLDALIKDKVDRYSVRATRRGDLLVCMYKTEFPGHTSRKGKAFLEETARLVGHTCIEFADKFYPIFCDYTSSLKVAVDEYLCDTSPQAEAAFNAQLQKCTEDVLALFPETLKACDDELDKLSAKINEGPWQLQGWAELLAIVKAGGTEYKSEWGWMSGLRRLTLGYRPPPRPYHTLIGHVHVLVCRSIY